MKQKLYRVFKIIVGIVIFMGSATSISFIPYIMKRIILDFGILYGVVPAFVVSMFIIIGILSIVIISAKWIGD
jgi:hypothetical protein